MIQALHNGASGMIAQQKNVDTIANNIANINTVGYVKNRVDFKDAIYSTMINPDTPGSTVNLQQGNGVLISGTSKIYTPSMYQDTDSPLDFSIHGEGFFTVQDENGGLGYTRDGNFKVSQTDGEQFLTTSGGQFVLDEDMQRIQIFGKATDMKVDSDGYITFDADVDPSYKISIVEFNNNGGLEAAGGNINRETSASGPSAVALQSKIIQKSLEGSNVDLTDEMTQLIKAQRAYQIASKAINTADQMEALANNLRN